MTDLNFYSASGLHSFVAAAQSAIEANTPATKCEGLFEQEMLQRILDTAIEAIGVPLPVQVGFDDDLTDNLADLVEYHMLSRLGLSDDCDLRQSLGFEFD